MKKINKLLIDDERIIKQKDQFLLKGGYEGGSVCYVYSPGGCLEETITCDYNPQVCCEPCEDYAHDIYGPGAYCDCF